MNAPIAVSPQLRRRFLGLFCAILFVIPVVSLQAYPKIFLKVDKIDGESTLKGYEKQIEIMSFSWGASSATNARTGSGAAVSKPSVSDLNLSKNFDSSSPALLMKLFLSERIAKATLTVVEMTDAAPKKVLELAMTDVTVSSLQASGSEGGNAPMESVSLGYQSLLITYTTPEGAKLTATWGGAVAP